MRWSTLSISDRFGLGLVLLVIINGVMLGFIRNWHNESVAANQEYLQQAAPLRYESVELHRRILNSSIAARNYLLTPDAESQAIHARRAGDIRQHVALIAAHPKTPAGDSLFAPIPDLAEAYLIEAERLVTEQAPEGELNLRGRRLALLSALTEFTELQDRNAGLSRQLMIDSQLRVNRGVVIAMLAGTLAFLVIASIIATTIRRPVRELVAVADAMSGGNWEPALALKQAEDVGRSRNEITHLEAALASAANNLERRESRLAANRAVASASSSGLRKDLIAKPALEAVANLLKVEIGIIYRVSRDGEELIPVVSRGIDAKVFPVAALEGLPGRAISERQAVVMRDVPPETSFRVRVGYDNAPPKTIVAVPMIARDTVLGVIVLGSLHDIDHDGVRFLEGAAQQLAVGFQNVRAFDEIRHLLSEVEAKSMEIQSQFEEIQSQNEELQSQSEEIQAQNEELQAQGEEIRAQNDELTEQSDALRAQTEALTESDARKNEFIGILAHELRNPMATLSNNLFVLRQLGGNSDKEVKAREAMERQARLLTRLMDDLLDITRVTHGKVQLRMERLELVKLVRDCIEDQRALAEKNQVTMTVDVPDHPIWIMADHSRISQVLCNLIDNAVKASEPGMSVRVVIRVDQQARNVAVHIIDAGRGIHPDVLPRLFQPFVQADPASHRGGGGLGLGLALVKALATMHDGAVEARSNGLGEGSEFIVTLPFEAGATQAIAPPSSLISETNHRSHRILIIEDNVDSAVSLHEALTLSGHSVQVAASAGEGITLLRQSPPDVLLCDIGLTDSDGYSVAREIAGEPQFTDTLLIAISGYTQPDDVRRAQEAGFHHHFAKPVPINRLNDLLQEWNSDGS